MAEDEDKRVTRAKAYCDGDESPLGPRMLLRDMIAYGEEQMALNLGLIHENKTLREQRDEMRAELARERGKRRE